MTRVRRLALTGSLLVLIVALAVATLLWRQYQSFLITPLKLPESGQIIEVFSGDSSRNVVSRLASMGITSNDWRWRLLLRRSAVTIKTGEFDLASGLTPPGLLELLASARVVQHRFTIVEGWTYRQLLHALTTHERLAGAAWTETDTDELDIWVRQMLRAADVEHPEGWFLPETYLFTKSARIRDILRRSHRALQQVLGDAWSSRREDSQLQSPTELLILASIIEKETAVAGERAKIAGVFHRRLMRGMRLQTDPTVIYGLGEQFDGDLRRRDLQADTPYNTYTRDGLPSTPIALAGRASILAAAQPEDGEAIFFVADGKGGHRFSVTLEQHQKAVQQLLQKP